MIQQGRSENNEGREILRDYFRGWSLGQGGPGNLNMEENGQGQTAQQMFSMQISFYFFPIWNQ